MLPPIESNGYLVTLDEHRAIIPLCRKCILEAYSAATLPVETPRYAPAGWKYKWDVLRRDRQGCLLVMIRCWTPTGVKVMSRRYRLVKGKRLPSSLRTELRGAL